MRTQRDGKEKGDRFRKKNLIERHNQIKPNKNENEEEIEPTGQERE